MLIINDNMDIIKIGKLIEPIDFLKYITVIEKLETVVHKYGTEFQVPDYPCWMKYENEGDIQGSISFTRHTYKHPELKEMVDTIYDKLATIFPKNMSPIKERIHIIKTEGDIVAHKDEAGRNTCINIGLQNSSGAITKMSNDGLLKNFYNNHTDYVIEEGYAYLVNVNRYHAVHSISDGPRYLITYGFAERFDDLKNTIQ